jgi:hypothetical protein
VAALPSGDAAMKQQTAENCSTGIEIVTRQYFDKKFPSLDFQSWTHQDQGAT